MLLLTLRKSDMELYEVSGEVYEGSEALKRLSFRVAQTKI
jgi:hypothetical protein